MWEEKVRTQVIWDFRTFLFHENVSSHKGFMSVRISFITIEKNNEKFLEPLKLFRVSIRLISVIKKFQILFSLEALL